MKCTSLLRIECEFMKQQVFGRRDLGNAGCSKLMIRGRGFPGYGSEVYWAGRPRFFRRPSLLDCASCCVDGPETRRHFFVCATPIHLYIFPVTLFYIAVCIGRARTEGIVQSQASNALSSIHQQRKAEHITEAVRWQLGISNTVPHLR